MIKERFRSVSYIITGFLVAASWLLPLAFPKSVSAAQITARSLTISSGVPSATATYTFNFTVPTTGTVIKSFSATACTTAVGSCTTPTGFSVSSSTLASQPTGMGSGTGWTVSTATAGQLRMSNSSNASDPSGSQEVVFGNVTNPSTANTSFFLRLTTFSDATWTTAKDTGTTAAAVVQTLTVNAAVAEILNFCVGSTAVNDATTSVASDCTGVSGTSVNLGTLDPTAVNITPVSTNGGDSNNAVAMVRTNAASGVAISYDAIQQSGTNHQGTLRISGATCSSSSGPGTGSGGTAPAASGPYTDQCIDAAGTTQNPFTAGSEQFGMTVAGVNCGSTTSYTCTYSSSTTNLTQASNYVGGSDSHTYGASAAKGFAWDESGTSQTIASSTTVVDDEALILKFAATPSITTPFGAYTAQSDFIAVPTY